MTVNKLILGDNLEILKTLDSDSVDLIYLDPPFFSNRNYEVIWGDAGEVRSFHDRWAGGMNRPAPERRSKPVWRKIQIRERWHEKIKTVS